MTKFLLIGLDGLRPDFVNDEWMPLLSALKREGTVFTRHRAMFPSETYVNLASILTGLSPDRHGIVANAFLLPEFDTATPWSGDDLGPVEASIRGLPEGLITAPTLGDRLVQSGKRAWIFSGNSAGSARQMHPLIGRAPGHLLFIGADWQASQPRSLAERIVARVSEPPAVDPSVSTTALQNYLIDAFLYLAETSELPEATVLWLGEPDNVLHAHGLGAERTIAELHALDDGIGRIVDWWHGGGRRTEVTMLVTSDHGHITQSRKVDVTGALRFAGYSVGASFADGAEVALVPGYAGNLRVRDGGPTLLASVARTLMAWPETGLLFTRGGDGVEGSVPGTFSQQLVRLQHTRSADLVFTLRTDNDTDAFGYRGTCRFDNELPVGVGYHGGLHPSELSAFLVGLGPPFREGTVSDQPTSVLDIMPTILSLLGEATVGLEGRSLTCGPQPCFVDAHYRVSAGSYAQVLYTTRVGHSLQINGGWRES